MLNPALQLFSRFITGHETRRAVFLAGCIRILNAGLILAIVWILARVLGPADFGVYTFVASLVLLAGIPTQLGLPSLLVREVSRATHEEDWPRLRGLIRFSNIVVLVMSVIGIAVILIITTDRRWSPVTDRGVVIAALPLLPLTALGNVRGAVLAGMGRVVWGQIPELVVRPGLLVIALGSCILLGYPLGPQTAMVFNSAAALCTVVIGVVVIHSLAPSNLSLAQPQFETRAWTRTLLPLSLISGLQMIRSQIDILLLGFLVSDADVGIFKIGATIALQVTFALGLVNAVLAPKIVPLRAKRDYAGLRALMRQGTKISLVTALPLALILVLFGREILRVAFGPQYVAAYGIMVVLTLAQCVYAAAGAVGILLTMSGNERELMIGIVVAIAANVGLNLLLIPRYGIMGAAVGSAVSMIVWRVLLIWLVRRSRVLHESGA